MAKTPRQKMKLLHIQKAFYERTDENHGLSLADITQILNDLGISSERKSLYGDIAELIDMGMNIEMRRSCKGEVTYHLLSREFELPELKLLVDSVQSSKFITEKKSKTLIGKLETLTSIHQAQALNRQVVVSNRIKTENESIYYAVDSIHEAINANKKITFKYFKWTPKKKKEYRHDGSRYTVSPWALTLNDDNYYMIAFDDNSKEVRSYRVDKMTSVNVTEDDRDGAEQFDNFDIAKHTNMHFGMFHGNTEIVELKCSNSLADVIIDRFGEDVPFTHHTDETFNAHVKVVVSPIFYGWLANSGRHITVVSPESVKNDYLAYLKKIIANYE